MPKHRIIEGEFSLRTNDVQMGSRTTQMHTLAKKGARSHWGEIARIYPSSDGECFIVIQINGPLDARRTLDDAVQLAVDRHKRAPAPHLA